MGFSVFFSGETGGQRKVDRNRGVPERQGEGSRDVTAVHGIDDDDDDDGDDGEDGGDDDDGDDGEDGGDDDDDDGDGDGDGDGDDGDDDDDDVVAFAQFPWVTWVDVISCSLLLGSIDGDYMFKSRVRNTQCLQSKLGQSEDTAIF